MWNAATLPRQAAGFIWPSPPSAVSALAAEEAVNAGRLLTFELEKEPFSRHIYMVYRKKGALSELAKAFVEQVRRSVQQG